MTFQHLRILILSLFVLFPIVSILVTHTGSIFLVVFTLGGIAALFGAKSRPKPGRIEQRLTWAFAAYFAVYLLSFAVNGLSGNLLDASTKHLDHEIRLLCLFPVIVLFRHTALSQKVLWIGITAGAIGTGLWSIVSSVWLFPGMRVTGSYHPIAFGDLSLALAFISVPSLGFFAKKHPGWMLIPCAAFVLAMTASILSETRGALIAVPVLLGILFFYGGKYLTTADRLLLVGLFCVLAVAACYIPSVKIVSRIQPILSEMNNYFHGSQTYTPVTVRLGGWRAAFDIFTDHPIIGAGPGNFKPLVLRMIEQGRQPEFISIHSQPHSAYLSAMADCGILGLAALLGLLATPVWAGYRLIGQGENVRDLGYALVLLALAFAHFAFTETIFGRSINVSYYIILTAGIVSAAATQRSARGR